MKSRQDESQEDGGKVRLDKWLWAARFFKTRQLAHEALELGRVTVNGDRAKASRSVNAGDNMVIRHNGFEYHIDVLGMSTQRKSAKDVAMLYRESAESVTQREERAALMRAEHASFPYGEGRPSKKARRDIMKFKGSF